MNINLLEKTELWINEITLDGVNLTEIANTVAKSLGLESEDVLVVDVRERHITLDIVKKDIDHEKIIGKEKDILNALGNIEGVHLYENTFIHSNGILGQICEDRVDTGKLISKVSEITDDITKNLKKRVLIYPTGFEVKQGLIEDTNTPFLKDLFESAGFTVKVGEIIEDNIFDTVEKLNDGLNRGFGTIITTGGVGAEDKDYSVEGLLKIDGNAATPYIVKFQKGTGRHKKDGVRIGVGEEGMSKIINLPGPNDEVRMAGPILLKGIEENHSKEMLANEIADVLREKWKGRDHHGL